MKIKDMTFQRIKSPEAFKKVVQFLTDDVIKNGGSASQIIDVHGALIHVTVCVVPGGTCIINKEVSEFEAWLWFNSPIE